jgi:hypothetical protein
MAVIQIQTIPLAALVWIQLASAGGPDGSFLIPQQGFRRIHPFLITLPLMSSDFECFP